MRVHLLHGAVGGPSDWHGFIPLLQGMDTEAVDLYAGEVSAFQQTADTLCTEADQGDALVGYSMGGRLALHALMRPGAPWSKAVIISADPGSGHDGERVARDREWAALARGDWDKFCAKWGDQPVFAGAEMPWSRGEVPKARREAIAQGFEAWSVGLQRDFRDELKDLEIPVLWIVGGDDEKFLRLATGLGGVTMSVVHGAGHRVPWDRPREVAGAIQSFLS